MGVSSSLTLQKSYGLPDNPEEFGSALAHVVTIGGKQDLVLGQAFLVDSNKLVTCGHVVDQFVHNPASLIVKFPSSGNCYQVVGVTLHPKFVRQPDQLVKFDIAVLLVELMSPEKDTAPLPIVFEKGIRTHQPLSAIRYPVHLGQFTATPNPLAQLGRMLGPLRKHDPFHLLHDLQLAPGDSGAPIFDGSTVVAIHCGDTATLPGLNLPTTAIRLMLWVDAVKELGVAETVRVKAQKPKVSFLPTATAFVASLMLSFLITSFAIALSMQKQWAVHQPTIMPISLSLNKSIHDYKYKDEYKFSVTPRSDSYFYVFDIDPSDQVMMVYPPYGELPSYVHARQVRTVDRFGFRSLKVGNDLDKLHIVSLISQDSLLNERDFKPKDPANDLMAIKGTELMERIASVESKDPLKVLHVTMDTPRAQGR